MPDGQNAIVLAHVALGTLAVAAGAGALVARKGAPGHIGAGRIFAVAMGLASLLGAILGLIDPAGFYITFHAGVLGVTLIASGWLAAASRSGPRGRAAAILGALNLANAAGLVTIGVHALSQPNSLFMGFAAEDYFFLSGMAGIAAIGDASLIVRRRISEKHRIARHLWRMCLGFFIAAGSAFTGPGAKAFPEAVKNSGVLSLPELVILLALMFWLGKTLWKGPPEAAR